MFLIARNGTDLFISFIHDKFIVKLRNGPISLLRTKYVQKVIKLLFIILWYFVFYAKSFSQTPLIPFQRL